MNFARQKCDVRAMQSVMRDDAFALQIGNEFGLHRVSAVAAQPRDSVQPPLDPFGSRLNFQCGRRGHPRIQQRRIDHPASFDRDGAAIGDAALTLWFAFEGPLLERVAELLPSGAPMPQPSTLSIAMQYYDYIFILCMRTAHEEPPHRALSTDLVGWQIAIGHGNQTWEPP
jgi:hypothetical protein